MACTTKRVILKTGIIAENTDELRNAKVESVSMRQGILGRILGYGDIIFTGSGNQAVVFKAVKAPAATKLCFEQYVGENMENNPFAKDLLNRKDLAECWRNLLLNDNKSVVIAISSDWGTGKTFMAENWHGQLQKEGYTSCFINAFSYDFIEDPFVVITSEILSQLKDCPNISELNKTADKLSTSLKTIGKHALNFIPAAIDVVITHGLAEKAVSEVKKAIKEIREATNAMPFANDFKAFNEYRNDLANFKEMLSNICLTSGKPIVVFVDELDRCNPDFAVKFLERLKHIFDIPKLKFILMINQKELSRTIASVYGSHMDGDKYLGKFINIYLDLEAPCKNKLNEFIVLELANISSPLKETIANVIIDLQPFFNVSLRDIQHLAKYFTYIPTDNDVAFVYIVTLLKVLHMKSTDLYAYFKNNDFENFRKYVLDKYQQSRAVSYLHVLLAGAGQTTYNRKVSKDHGSLGLLRRYRSIENLLAVLKAKVGIGVSF